MEALKLFGTPRVPTRYSICLKLVDRAFPNARLKRDLNVSVKTR